MKIAFTSLLFFLLFINSGHAQTMKVSKDFESRKILLEEFTGMHCGYCPQGHTVARNLTQAQKGNIYVLAIHTGFLSVPGSDEPDFRCDYGEALYKQSGEGGFPSGTLNREMFRSHILTLDRSTWGIYGREIVKDTAKVNLWMECSIDKESRVANIRVEGYYSMDLGQNYALLNIAMTENNIKGPQTGAGIGSDYIHQHVLRDLITGQWGDTLYKPMVGEYFTKTYTYTIPDSLKKVPLKLEDLEFIAFVNLDTIGVLNVTGVKASIPTLSKALAAQIKSIKISKTHAYTYFPVYLENLSSTPIHSAEFLINIGSNKQTCSWTGNIPPFSEDSIHISCKSYAVEKFQNYSIELKGLNQQAYVGNKLTGVFQAPSECTPKIFIEFMTDVYGADNTLYLKDREGNILKKMGPFTDKVKLYRDSFEFTQPGVYAFELTDAWANGVIDGFYRLYDADHRTIFAENNTILDFGDIVFFNTVEKIENEAILYAENLRLNAFPNPANGNTQINFICPKSGNANLAIFDIQGKRIFASCVPVQANTPYQQPISNLQTGFYFVKISQNENSKTLKLIIQ
ncbi:MAG: Omp28-related outer membrane protein [Bacteroidales bacterium]